MREPFARRQRLGAAKKKKRLRRTEGRTGLSVGARDHGGGHAALCNLADTALRHGPVAVPPVKNIPTLGLSGGKFTVFFQRLRGFTLILCARAIG